MKRCLKNLDDVGPEVRGCSLAIGNFDGVHLGHQKILLTARALAEMGNKAVVALTFDPPPEAILRPDKVSPRLLPHDRKCRAIHEAGADVVVIVPATRELLGMTANEFVEEIIVRRFGALHVVEGRDFRFGARRGGDVGLLNLMGCHYGFAVHVVEAVMTDLPQGPERISSTLIRRLIADGDVEAAARCLGRPYALYGKVIPGQGVGRLMEFPTANIAPGQQVIPADGVYAGFARIDSKDYVAAISVGHKLTLGPAEDLYIEAFLLDVKQDFYGRSMELSFLRRLRGQEKFADMEALRRQIALDVEQVREVRQTARDKE